MKAIFRTDSSATIGTGHVMRCLALADALRGRGIEVQFICRILPGDLRSVIEERAYPVVTLPPSGNAEAESKDVNSGLDEDSDAEQTISAIGGSPCDQLIVDHYRIAADWERRLRPHAANLMVIDDFTDRQHYCDTLLNQNFLDGSDIRYEEVVPSRCRLLLGPRYALLRPEYAAHRRMLRPRDGAVRRVLVFFGGSDPLNLTGLALEVLSAPGFRHIEVDVVAGANYQHNKTLEGQVAARPRTTLHGPRRHLADLIVEADLAIGAGGVTTWERMCLGLPSVVTSISDNQRPGCQALGRKGLIHCIERIEQASELSNVLAKCLEDSASLRDMSMRGQLLVDGLGALRVVESLYPTSANALRLRPARPEDTVTYFNWANDSEVRRQALNTEPIPWSEHQSWFSRKLSDPTSRLFVLEAHSLPVGQIRFDEMRAETRISYSLDALVRGRGWAKQLVSMGIARMSGASAISLRAEVKAGNRASLAVFRRLGFKEIFSSVPDMHIFISANRVHPTS